jgi:cytochrome P450
MFSSRIAKRLTAERFKPGAKSQRDMMGSFIRHGLTQEETEGESLIQVVAGSDTTATTIRVVLLNLLTSPLTYQRLQSEIDSAATSGKISSPIKDSEAREMPYLQAVIKEGLRILPPVTGISFKTVPKGGDTINGIFIPEGTDIGFAFLALHHSKKIFGDDADVFRAERWLEAEGERLAVMKGTSDLVFNHGRFQCLGKPVALMELNKIFVEVGR